MSRKQRYRKARKKIMVELYYIRLKRGGTEGERRSTKKARHTMARINNPSLDPLSLGSLGHGVNYDTVGFPFGRFLNPLKFFATQFEPGWVRSEHAIANGLNVPNTEVFS
jgi:hypothetical protein